MRKFGLIGYPLGHSFSKKYFAEKFIREDIRDCSYENYPLTDIGLLTKLIADEPDLAGLNVTIPYKTEVIRYLNFLSPEAEDIGAVNVIRIKRSDNAVQLSGYNSDVTGIMASVLPFASHVKNAAVLGTGGSSRAVCYVLGKLGVNITLVSRNCSHGTISYQDMDSEFISGIDLIVNTTPLGMYPAVDTKPDINYGLLGKKHILFDLVYNPELTSFLKMGRKQGCTTIGGLKMLHAQAEKAWGIWNDAI
jgi:shikimate dehydrogenase